MANFYGQCLSGPSLNRIKIEPQSEFYKRNIADMNLIVSKTVFDSEPFRSLACPVLKGL